MPFGVEILGSILSYLDDVDLSRCATVSKEWSSISLDLKWSTVTDLVRLLHALIPLTQVANNVYVRDPPSPPNSDTYQTSIEPSLESDSLVC